MIIYADVMFLINLTSNYMILLILGKAISKNTTLIRLLCASALGAAVSSAAFCANFHGIFIMKIALSAAMAIIAYGFKKTDFLRDTAIFVFLLYAFSGIVFLLISVFRNNTLTLIKNGILYFDVSEKALFAAMAAAYLLAFIIIKIIKHGRRKNIFPIKIELNDAFVTINALHDSGNLLKEPKSGKSVIIAEWDTVRDLFGFEYDELFSHAGEFGISVIPYSSVGQPEGVMPVFTADRAHLNNRVIQNAVIGISRNRLCKSGNYRALFGSELL